MSKDDRLYGIPRQKKATGKEISSSSTLAFTSQLSSLISSSNGHMNATARVSARRARPKKEDIFSTHNKNSKKRAAKDQDETDFTQKHSTRSEAVDEATLHRSKRRMEEKARLYAALKRGDIEDLDEKYGVDFDRKWAERQEAGKEDSDISDDDDDPDSENGELVDYTDEFGRARKGTRADVAREEARKRMIAAGVNDPDRFTARPAMPTNIIHGDTVQYSAFNPDHTISEQMAALAAKRDKEATPPPDTHFDGKAEIRTKGAGFFQLSGDAEERKRQMANLENERMETEARQAEARRRKDDRKKKVEERRKAIQEKRSKTKADRFLDDLMGEMGQHGDEKPVNADG
ncbi:hypothetical protein FKW77_000764 [Venturia effusa]|uniref:Uncharacterized protein n=1 Tax=Venturia effusa TaxID=50376 RepID=A0A517LI00_9PEZI|nr:hypothetical protein FKW77_000764 [Venturia effusa]